MLQIASNSKYINFVKLNECFGHWRILDITAHVTKNKRQSGIYFLCKCNICQIKTQFVNIHQLKKHKSFNSGGCISCSRKRNTPSGNESILWKGYEEIPMSYIHNIRNSAIRRNLKWDVDLPYLWNLFLHQNRMCKISGVSLNFSSSINLRDGTASLDRIDRSIGYIRGNLQWVHKIVNEMKWDMTDVELINWCNTISHYNGK